jgi:hypothetical protein
LKIRSASLLDLGRIEQIHREAEARLSASPPPARLWSLVSQTLTALLPLNQESLLYVAEEDGTVIGFVQASSPTASLTLAPRITALQVLNLCVAADSALDEEDVAAPLVERLVREAGAKGVHRLFVRVPLDDALLPLFRMQGFRQYASESLLFTEAAQPRTEVPEMPGTRPYRWRDERRLFSLYRKVTPVAVAQLEAPNHRQWRATRGQPGQQEVVDRMELVAWSRVHRGSDARPHTLSFMVIPDPPLVAELADHVLTECAGHPAWASLRHYDAPMIDALRGRGFSSLLTQALLVRDTTVREELTERALVPSLG